MHFISKQSSKQTQTSTSFGVQNLTYYTVCFINPYSFLCQQHATQLVWERMKLLIEPTAGVGLAAVLSQHFQTVSPEVKNICIVLSGGNVDLTSLNWVKQAESPYQTISV